MTLEKFFQLFPVSRAGIAKMMAMPAKRLYNIQQRDSLATAEEIEYLNEAVQQLSYQLSRVHLHNKNIYRAKCRLCNSEFKVIDEGNNTLFYAVNGLVCNRCKNDPECQDSLAPPPPLPPGMA
jgi:hypothetical protein